MAITEQDRAEWRGHPVTKELLSQLQASKQEVMEAWAGEGFVAQSIEQSAVQNAAALGGVRVLDDLIEQLTVQPEVINHSD